MSGATRPLNIQPEVGILAVLRHVNYRPWFALAEFVDNAVQSFTSKRGEIKRVDGRDAKLRVDVEWDPSAGGRLTIRDNAAGISDAEYDRAFKTAQAPPDVTGLSEFGMGMKSAACWFAANWSVRSKALGETEERYVEFDVDQIVSNGIEQLTATVSPAARTDHYTEIVLHGLHRPLQTKTIPKVREHLASMYRHFIHDGTLVLSFRGEALSYKDPRILTAPEFHDTEGPAVEWRKAFNIAFDGSRRVYGYAAIRETGSTSDAGFAIFRRNRLIQGSADEGYRPELIFKKSNSYTYQRLFGELHVENFEVTHTKDGIRWDADDDLGEHEVLEALAKELNRDPLRILEQAEGYRVRARKRDVKAAAEAALSGVTSMRDQIQSDLGADQPVPRLEEAPLKLDPTPEPFSRVMEMDFRDSRWTVTIEASTDPTVSEWVSVSQDSGDGERQQVSIRISFGHPFMTRYAGYDSEKIEPLVRLAVGLGLAEVAARQGGVRMARIVRDNLNLLLRSSLSRP